MNTTEVRAAILSEATEALDGTDVTATDDPTTAASTVTAGGTALLVLAAPELTWETWHQVVATWTVWVIVGSTSDPAVAADHMDAVLSVLAQPLGLDSARPQTYDLAGHSWPGYELTFTTSTL